MYFEELSTAKKHSMAHSPVCQQQRRATVRRKQEWMVLSSIYISQKTKTNGTDTNISDDTDENNAVCVWIITAMWLVVAFMLQTDMS